MAEYGGSSPIANVLPPVSSSVVTSTRLRPTRSPKWPNTIPPSGRARKPTPNVASEANVPATGDTDGKNSVPNTRLAASP
jgi:hypothetical protein